MPPSGGILSTLDTVGASGDDASAMQAQGDSTVGDASAGSNLTMYLGMGVGVGGALLTALVIVAIMAVRKRRQHKRMIAAMEVEEILPLPQTQEIPHPTSVLRRSIIMPLQSRAGWDALASNEAVHETEPVEHEAQRKRSSVRLPKKFRQRGIPLKKLKRLTAILESPMMKMTASPVVDGTQEKADADRATPATPSKNKSYSLQQANEDDVFVCPGSPKPHVLPSFAIRSPGRYGAGIANDDNPKAKRSKSVGSMPAIPDDAIFGFSSRMRRGSIHARSLSLGAPPSRPPSGPVPPLPVIDPHDEKVQESARQGLCVQRLSSSSQGTVHSSVLVTTPILRIPERHDPMGSPSVEEIVADDDSASLKEVSTNRWEHSALGERKHLAVMMPKGASDPPRGHTSIRSNIARYSAGSLAARRSSSGSLTSNDSLRDRLSIAQLGVADHVSMSRVSSTNSLQGVRKVTTPRRQSKISVSASGSPAERKKSNILRDISGNSLGPSRHPSNATQASSRSSKSNPFQWDLPLQKPSALKGSPNARKGHKRQNCVRISTLTPQILGPPPSRPTSPSIMDGIEEESGDDVENVPQPRPMSMSNRRTSRPLSSLSLGPTSRVQPLRASLTPSSPTLSAWVAFQGHEVNGLPSQISDSQLSVSVGTRSLSRLSNRSSIRSTLSFPSPVRAVASTTQLSQPIPAFYLSRPSNDIHEEDRSSPFEVPSDPEIPSSPPLPVSKRQEYDPAWRDVTLAVPREYDPASPQWNGGERERSSLSFPFATELQDEDSYCEIPAPEEAHSTDDEAAETALASPKTMPAGFNDFFDMKDTGSKPAREVQKLTSANASAIMARLPSPVDFPGAPVLAPPEEDEVYAQMTPQRQSPSFNASFLQPSRPAPPIPSPWREDCVPSPLHVSGKTSPTGPRNQPAQSVLKNAMALRRMNSEITIADRQSRRYVHLGREASPLLPWIGFAQGSASCADMNDLFDFDLGLDVEGGAEASGEVLSDNVLSEMERKLHGALAGIDANSDGPSVWEDGEKFWDNCVPAQNDEGPIGVATSSSVAVHVTPKKQIDVMPGSPRSVQKTPASLYDSDGFLRT